jgi:error-prone DNA polymerase
MRPEFTHLHVASSYSLRYGTAAPAALAARAASLGLPAQALTDRDGLYGAFKHVQACADAGIKPILGASLRVSNGKVNTDNARVTLLAVGRQGWASLCRLVSAAHARAEEAGDSAPSVTQDLIAEHAPGLVVLLGPGSDVGAAVAGRRRDQARRALDRWRRTVDTVIEVVDHLDPKSTVRAAWMAELARDTRTTAVLTNAVRYLAPADSLTAQVLDAARHQVPLGSPRLATHNGRAYLASQQDMTAIAHRVAAAMTGPGTASAAGLLLADTGELAQRCVLDPAHDLGVGAHHLPETNDTAYDQFRELSQRCEHAILNGHYRTAKTRHRGVSRLRAAETARERLDQELDIIARTGMAAYFLTVADVADRVRNAGIRCAIRGSGAGSFVNHLLGISAIDPLEHDLLMERFLSPIRNTLPDIDLDVESARRLDAYRIIFDAYGADRTAAVCMMETYRARSAIRDVAAAMSLPPDEIGAIAKAFPHIRAKHITAALSELPELRQSRLGHSQLGTIFTLAQQLDGLPRHVAMHPCGVLLSDRTLRDRTAMQASGEGFPLSQLDKDDAEIAGVIKLDVLGVRMQSAMAYTLTEIDRTTRERIDLDAMPRDDPATYAMIGRSETIGCFQIESPGQRELVKKLAPRDVADLIVDISLFRPGPVNSDMIGPFLRARHGLAEPRYPHQALAKALKETGGVVVFHEQLLRIVDELTGCGLAEADLVRRHLSTEGGPARTAPWFRARARARSFDPVTVERVWQVVAAFGGFGFCKAHAAAFAIPVYQSAWLRRHHPAAFYAGVLTHDPGMYPKRVIIADARLSGIEVLPVDINASAADWRVVPQKNPIPSPRTIAASSAPAHSPRPPASPRLASPTPESSRPTRSAARRLLESTAPLRTLRLPARKPPPRIPGGRPPVPPGAPQAIRCSFREVKGISDAEIARVVAGQPYTSLRDFWARARVSRPVAERLVLIGAFDSLYPPPRRPASDHSHASDHPRHADHPRYAVFPAPGIAPPAPNVQVPPRPPESPTPPESLPPRSSSPSFLPVPPSPRSPSRRDLLARVGVLARQSTAKQAPPAALDLFAAAETAAGTIDAETADGMASLVPAGQLRDLDLAERVQAELEILGFDVSQHVLDFYADLLAGLGVVRSADLADRQNGESILVAGAKVATQTPAVRSGQRIIFASLDDAAGLVDLAFFESVQPRCAARLFGSWLLVVRGRVRRAGAGPMAVTLNATECWDLPALEHLRLTQGLPAVRTAMENGDVPATPHLTPISSPADPFTPPTSQATPDPSARPVIFANGFILSPYAETGAPGPNLKHPPRTLWHASPGSTTTPN